MVHQPPTRPEPDSHGTRREQEDVIPRSRSRDVLVHRDGRGREGEGEDAEDELTDPDGQECAGGYVGDRGHG